MRQIQPNPATEAQKQILANQLSKKNSYGQNNPNPHNVPADEFFERKKEQFLQEMQAKGVDFFAAKDFIESRGIYSMNEKMFIHNMNNQFYQNPLRRQG